MKWELPTRLAWTMTLVHVDVDRVATRISIPQLHATNVCEQDSADGGRRLRNWGWCCSAVIHGLFITLMMVCRPHVTSIPVIPQKQPFRWDVTLTASPKDEPIVAESPELPPPAEPDSPPSATVHAQLEDRGDAHARGPVASLLSAGPTPGGGFQSSMTESAEPDKPSMQVIPAADASAVVPPDVESPRESDRLQVRTDLENPTVVRRPGPINRPVVNRIARQDYTWLMDTLRSRLEQVKVYPPSARANHAQGRVLVQVSIQDDGRIEDVEIEESSGHPILDLAACVALRDASPLALDHEIEGAPVIMVVPLRYQLE